VSRRLRVRRLKYSCHRHATGDHCSVDTGLGAGLYHGARPMPSDHELVTSSLTGRKDAFALIVER
jgi:hypothetical protein